jgi:hypothetical protein
MSLNDGSRQRSLDGTKFKMEQFKLLELEQISCWLRCVPLLVVRPTA